MPSGNWNSSTVGQTSVRSYSNTNPRGSVTTRVDTFGTVVASRNSTVTPGYTGLKRTGDLPENSFGFSEIFQSSLIGDSRKESHFLTNYSGTQISGVIATASMDGPPWGVDLDLIRANLRNEAISKMNSRVIDSDIDLSVMAGEFRETVRMHKDLALRLRDALRHLRSGNFGGVATALSLRNSKDWANAWLLAQYGIKPLVNDVLGGIKALEKGMLKERYVIQAARQKYQDQRTYQKGALADGLWTYEWSLSVEAAARCKYHVSDPYTATLASLGLVNPFGLAWELMKLSFVVDWAIGVGAWLNQLGVYFGRKYSSGSTTTFTRITGYATYNRSMDKVNGPFRDVDQSSARMTRTDVTVNRVGSLTPPVQYLPAIKDPVSLFTVTTSLALLRQAYSR